MFMIVKDDMDCLSPCLSGEPWQGARKTAPTEVIEGPCRI